MDAYIYRAKLNLKTKRYDEALKDFDAALKLSDGSLMTLMSRCDCLKLLNRLNEAIDGYSKCLKMEPHNYGILLKRAICFYETSSFELSRKDLQVLIERKQGGSDAYYFRAMI